MSEKGYVMGEGVAVTTAPGEAGAAAPGAHGDDVAMRAAAGAEDRKMMKEEAGKAINGGQEY